MFYFLLILAIGLPLIAPNRYKYVALIGSMLLLFVPWGLQYEMVQDWNVNLERWTMVNVENRLEYESGRMIEPLYAFLMSLFFPKLGFFTWLITCAIIELFVIFYYTRKFAVPSMYWVVLFVLMLTPNYGLLYINSNRQMLSVVLTMLANLIFIRNMDRSFRDNFITTLFYVGLSILIIYGATQIHTGANVAYLLPLIYLFVKFRNKHNKWLAFGLLNVLFLVRFFMNPEGIIQSSLLMADDFDLETFDAYLEEFSSSSDRSFSMVGQPLYWIIMNLSLWFYEELDKPHKFFAICGIIGIIGDGFVINTLARTLCYFNIYMILLVPRLVECCEEHKTMNNLLFMRTFFCILIVYDIFLFYKCQTESLYYSKWTEFQTIFSAPHWI